jgi:hypothetical protein
LEKINGAKIGYVQDVRYADFASLHGCNLLGQRRSSCRGAKIGYVQDVRYADFAGAKIGEATIAEKALF